MAAVPVCDPKNTWMGPWLILMGYAIISSVIGEDWGWGFLRERKKRSKEISAATKRMMLIIIFVDLYDDFIKDYVNI